MDFCCEYMEKDLNEDNFLYLQELALLYSLERLDAFIDRFILEHFSTLSSTIEFLDNVSVHKLSSYLCSDQVRNTDSGIQPHKLSLFLFKSVKSFL